VFYGEGTWTDIWKGFGALIAAYVFAALASRALARSSALLRDPGPEGLSGSW